MWRPTLQADSQACSHRSKRTRHTAKVKRLCFMACQPAIPICSDSFRPWTRVYVFLPGGRISSRCCTSRAACVYTPPLYLVNRCGNSRSRARRRTGLLAGVQCAQGGPYYASQTPGPEFERLIWAVSIGHFPETACSRDIWGYGNAITP